MTGRYTREAELRRQESNPFARLLVIVAIAFAPAFATAASAQEDMPTIMIVATGGTIANTPDGRIAPEAIIEAMPEVLDYAELLTVDVTRVGSSTLSWQEFIDTAKAIETVLEEQPEVDGFVVTIGSNTSEDMAYFLNLVVHTDKPIVVTAAQRQRTTMSEDASRNFLDAVITAASPEASGMGVVMVVNEQIHAARDVAKNVVSRVDTWESVDFGVLGLISDGEAHFYRAPLRLHTMDSEFSLDGIETADDLPKVEILYSYVDAAPYLIEAAVENGADGLVIATFLTGSAHAGQRPVLEAAMEQGVAVALATRGTSGRVDTEGGSYSTIGADTLTPQHAAILLMIALTVTDDPAELQRIFDQY